MRISLSKLGVPSRVAFIFVVLAAAIAGMGYVVFDYQRQAASRDAEKHLSVIAGLKGQLIAAWMQERRTNAKVQGQRSFLAKEVVQWLKNGAVEGAAAAAIRSRFAKIAELYGYRIVTLVDAQGRPLLSLHDPPEISEVESKAVAEVMRTGNIVISQFHRSVNTGALEAEIDILAPVYDGKNSSVPIAVLIFVVDAETSLHPLIESWPVPSASAETYLVERNDDHVRYITELRHRKDAQFKLHLPLDQPDLVEAMGLKGQQGAVTGVDYRGEKVLAFLQPIPDTPWVMVAKVDRAEIYASVQNLAVVEALVTAIFVLAAALTTLKWMRVQRESEEKFHGFAEAADQVFWITKLSPERIDYVNPAFESMWGRSSEDLYRNPGLWMEAIHSDDRPRIAAAFGTWIQGVPEARFHVEYRIVRPDGQIRWIADHGFVLKTRGRMISRVAGIAEDITDQKRAEEALRQTNAELEERVQLRTAELNKSHQELQALIAVQESFQEEERKRIARDLHDELAQKLTVLKLQLASVISVVSVKDTYLALQMQDMSLLLTETIHAVDHIACNLRPVLLDQLGLVTALRDLVEDFSERTGVECEFSVHPADLCVDDRRATPIYRMAQESLTNVARHAQASEVMVSLYRDPFGKITMDIHDNGQGFANVDQGMCKSFGLIGMRERAAMLGGEMKIHSEPGTGTSIEIVIP